MMVTVTETCSKLYIIEYIVFWLNDILVNYLDILAVLTDIKCILTALMAVQVHCKYQQPFYSLPPFARRTRHLIPVTNHGLPNLNCIFLAILYLHHQCYAFFGNAKQGLTDNIEV